MRCAPLPLSVSILPRISAIIRPILSRNGAVHVPPDDTRADDLGDAAIATRPERSSDRQAAGSGPAHRAALHRDASGSWHPDRDNARAVRRLPSAAGVQTAAAAGALAKIEWVLPDTLRERLQAVRDVVAFTAAADVPRPDSGILMRLSLAIQRGERVKLWYQSGTAETERR